MSQSGEKTKIVVCLHLVGFQPPSHYGKERVTGVGAFAFDDTGYEKFLDDWRPRIAGLKKPFHMAHCYGDYGEFGEPSAAAAYD